MAILSAQQRQELVQRVVQTSLERGGRTRFVGTRAEDFDAIGSWIQSELHSSHIALIADERTYAIEGEQVRERLLAAGIEVTLHLVSDRAPGVPPICSTQEGHAIAHALAATPIDAFVSVGGGTLTDLGKVAARARQVPQVVVATAASMNGFTSSLAAVLDHGVKLTSPAPAPIAVFGHPRTLREAPARMTASGLGDLHSKPVSSADWRLSHLLNDAPWDVPVVALLDEVATLIEGVADGLHQNDEEAAAQLFAGLCLTGIAMQSATKGSQASGAEHLFSHYLDMIGGSPAFAHQPDTHGAQVAVGCMVTLDAWEFALERLRTQHAFGPIPARLLNDEARDAYIGEHFRDLAPAIQAMHERTPTTSAQREARRARLASPEGLALLQDAAGQLPSRTFLARELRAAGCATCFSELAPMTSALAADTIRYAPWVRARYTILHLIDELGWYADFEAYALARNMAPADY